MIKITWENKNPVRYKEQRGIARPCRTIQAAIISNEVIVRWTRWGAGNIPLQQGTADAVDIPEEILHKALGCKNGNTFLWPE